MGNGLGGHLTDMLEHTLQQLRLLSNELQADNTLATSDYILFPESLSCVLSGENKIALGAEPLSPRSRSIRTAVLRYKKHNIPGLWETPERAKWRFKSWFRASGVCSNSCTNAFDESNVFTMSQWYNSKEFPDDLWPFNILRPAGGEMQWSWIERCTIKDVDEGEIRRKSEHPEVKMSQHYLSTWEHMWQMWKGRVGQLNTMQREDRESHPIKDKELAHYDKPTLTVTSLRGTQPEKEMIS